MNYPEVVETFNALSREIAEREARIAELEKYKAAVEAHNAECQRLCGIGDQEAVRCGYRPYFEYSKRRCTTCPTDWIIYL